MTTCLGWRGAPRGTDERALEYPAVVPRADGSSCAGVAGPVWPQGSHARGNWCLQEACSSALFVTGPDPLGGTAPAADPAGPAGVFVEGRETSCNAVGT